MNEDELANQIKQYTELKKQNKDIDVASLALTALQTHEDNQLTAKEKRTAYIVSFALPPLGLIYALKFFTSNKSDARAAAWMCVGLTVLTIVLTIVIINGMFASTGISVQQLQQTPAQYQDLLQ
jgi:hypothetical protein